LGSTRGCTMLASRSSRAVPTDENGEAQPRGWFGAALGLVLLLVFGFGLGLLVGWPSLPRKATEAGVGADISGVATCNGYRLTVTKMWLWTQSPTPLSTTQITSSDVNNVLKLFQGKNAIAWSSTMDLTGFTYDRVDGDTIVMNEMLSSEPTECHFTIDEIIADCTSAKCLAEDVLLNICDRCDGTAVPGGGG